MSAAARDRDRRTSPQSWLRRVRPVKTPELVVDEAWHHFAVGFVGDIGELAAHLHDASGEWPEVEVLAAPPRDATTRRADVVWVRVRSTTSPRTAAVLRVLDLAGGASVRVADWVPFDVVDDVSSEWLATELAACSQEGDEGTHRRDLEALGGWAVADRLFSRVCADNLEERLRTAAASTLGFVTFNTADPELKARVLDEALSLSGRDAAGVRAAVALLVGQVPTWELISRGAVAAPPGESTLAALAGQADARVSDAAVHLLSLLPGTRQPDAVAALRLLATAGLGELSDEQAGAVERAIAVLANAPTTTALVDVVEQLFEGAPRAGVRQQAATTLVALLGVRARDVWVRLLASRGAGDPETGERLLAKRGTAEDLGVALQAAQRLLRRKPSDEVHDPPSGADLLGFLVRFRGHLEVDALLFQVGSRWPRLPEDLRGWLEEHHPWIAPS